MNSKKLGQNFLQDISIIKQIVKALDIGKDDTIVEIGSGSGNLTRELVKENNLIYALEFDQNLGEKLRKNITDPNLRIHIGDARIIQPEEFLNSDDYKLVGNLPYYAAKASSYGLPFDEALRSITLSTAEILGVDEHVGSLEAGKDATFFISDGNILDVRTQVNMAFIQGKRVDLSDRHKTLYSKYRNKYQQIGILK